MNSKETTEKQIVGVTTVVEAENQGESAREEAFLEDRRMVQAELEERIALLQLRIKRACAIAEEDKGQITQIRAEEKEIFV